MKNHLGIIGLSTMGANLAQNLADHKFQVAIFNRSSTKTDSLMAERGEKNGLNSYYNFKDFTESLDSPKIILLMVQAGKPVDAVLEELKPLLKKGDIIIDGGNSYFKDTIRRQINFNEEGINYAGMGISGGEEGARRGPSIMPGTEKDVWKIINPIFSQIAAKDFHGLPCITLIGQNGAGHFVKMVHNAIEYVDMQLIAETYWLMRNGLKMSNEAMAKTFAKWNKGKLNSYLIEITAKILATKDIKGKYIIDRILDCAGNKGTGKWTSLEALDMGVPAFSISAAVFARYISAFKKERLAIAAKYKKTRPEFNISITRLEKTLYAAKILAYAQGYELINYAAKEYQWNIDLKEVSRIWEGGCIIRARFLDNLYQIFKKTPKINNILLSDYFRKEINLNLSTLRQTAAQAIRSGLPIPALLSCLSYFDSITSACLPANLLQAQRDFFGAHTFQTKIDGEYEHFDWE